jgi:hypothetical protein
MSLVKIANIISGLPFKSTCWLGITALPRTWGNVTVSLVKIANIISGLV